MVTTSTDQEEPPEPRETVAYTMPRRLIDAVAMHAITGRFTSKSHAAQDIIERGLQTLAATAEREQVAS